ncbi:DUF2189 domain-containing protein [Thalassorhabdomicrobium marinisediminis]|uniref:DUF2189 domain-containing protein n=1 Tax=Thalassorhabdomicrobium marinisediminis TaxID=2170577 RepID=UPI00249032D4|nr:DUF2189 domain-containing protein [Thalassorhabdomicrobium marinisediminis]
MTDLAHPAASPVPEIGRLTVHEIWTCLKAGLHDFRTAPQFGLLFSSLYVLGGFLMTWLGAGHVTWVLATSLGFPLAAPFAAVGLYEVSRRLEADQPLEWRAVLGVVWAERTRQVPWIGAIIVIYFLFWTFLAHLIFALFMGVSTLTHVTTSWEVFLTPPGLAMMTVELIVGGVLAFGLFSLTVVSLPLVLEREIDFVSAMLLSIRTVARNPGVMLLWAAVIAGLTFVALLPWFLGLIVVLPVLGHATWHIYRRALYDPL